MSSSRHDGVASRTEGTHMLRVLLPWGLILALAVVLLGTDYALGKATLVVTYAIAGLGVVVVVGQAGQIALGQAALVALGAYAQAVLVSHGVSPLLALPVAAAVGALGGVLASLPARRLGGLYFGMSTLAFALIVEEALVRAEPLTHGSAGMTVGAFSIFGWRADSTIEQAGVSLVAFAIAVFGCSRLLHSRHGRAWRAVRDDEVAGAACGIAAAAVKMQAFVVGGALSGLAGGALCTLDRLHQPGTVRAGVLLRAVDARVHRRCAAPGGGGLGRAGDRRHSAADRGFAGPSARGLGAGSGARAGAVWCSDRRGGGAAPSRPCGRWSAGWRIEAERRLIPGPQQPIVTALPLPNCQTDGA